jgi:uncharacterized protein YneF (UPF0154 family)
MIIPLWVKIVGIVLGVLLGLFLGLIYWICKSFSKIPPMLGDAQERAEWIAKNCMEKD